MCHDELLPVLQLVRDLAGHDAGGGTETTIKDVIPGNGRDRFIIELKFIEEWFF